MLLAFLVSYTLGVLTTSVVVLRMLRSQATAIQKLDESVHTVLRTGARLEQHINRLERSLAHTTARARRLEVLNRVPIDEPQQSPTPR